MDFEDDLGLEGEVVDIEEVMKKTGWYSDDKWTKQLRDEQLGEDDIPKPKVTTYEKKRYPFFKLPYNENHIPHQGTYNKIKQKKPKLA